MSSFFTQSAYADGKELLQRCKLSQQFIKSNADIGIGPIAGYCVGYAQAAAEVLNILSDTAPQEARVCLPAKISQLEMVNILTSYLDGHHDQLDSPSSVLAMVAFSEAYPCHKK